MNGIHILQIPFEFAGQRETLFPVLLQDEQELILVDCGYPGFVPKLEEAAKRIHIRLETLTKIIVTHHDMDHVGCLAALKSKFRGRLGSLTLRGCFRYGKGNRT